MCGCLDVSVRVCVCECVNCIAEGAVLSGGVGGCVGECVSVCGCVNRM